MEYTREQIAQALDLAVLKPLATVNEIIAAAQVVEVENIRSLCVASCNVIIAKRYTDRVGAVIGFPSGNSSLAAKLREAMVAIDEGATELDVVINYGRLLEGGYDYVERELRSIVELAHGREVLVKAILETAHYEDQRLVDACKMAVNCGVDFVKTSTGFSSAGGATQRVAEIMLRAVAGKCGVKASGGIKTYQDAKLFLDLGCSRLGSSTFHGLLPPEDCKR